MGSQVNKSTAYVLLFFVGVLSIISATISDSQASEPGWTISTVDTEGNVGYFSSIAIDSNNKVHISYLDLTNRDLKYATNALGSWVTAAIDGAGFVVGGVGGRSIAIDSNNKIHITYFDGTRSVTKYATNVSGSWVTSTI